MSRKAEIAIIIPCYNDDRFVRDAITSVQSQSYEAWECVVVDDGSTDDSCNVIREAAKGDRRIRPERHSDNRGLSAARNTGLALSTAPLIAFLDSDDLMLPMSLEHRLAALVDADQPDVAGSYTGVRYEPTGTDLSRLPLFYKSGPTTKMDFVSADGECPFPIHAPLTKRSTIEMVGGFDETMTTGAEDWDMWYRVLRAGFTFVPAPSTSVIYRFRDGGMTRLDARAHMAAATRLIKAAHSASEDARSSEFPHATTKPLAEYRVQITIARRGLRFAAMAALDGRVQEAMDIVVALEVTDWTVVMRHVDIEDMIARAERRVSRSNPELHDRVAALLIDGIARHSRTASSPEDG